MRPTQLESLVLTAVDDVASGKAIEDSRIELKRDWPHDIAKAARRLAGHCNAAMGDTVVWIIGLDEKDGVIGCKPENFANWWPQVQSLFEDKSPALLADVAVNAEQQIVAMAFSSEAAPFVIRNPNSGAIELETPWREGTRVRSARRQDLLRLFGRRLRSPHVDVVQCTFSPSELPRLVSDYSRVKHELNQWRLKMQVAVTIEPGGLCRYLLHRSTVELPIVPQQHPPHKPELNVRPHKPKSQVREFSETGVRLDGTVVEISRATTLDIEVQYEFDGSVNQLESAGGQINLYPAADDPPLRIPIPPCKSRWYAE